MSLTTIQSMAWGIAVSKEVAEHVLAVLSRLTQVEYTLERVEVAIFIEGSCFPNVEGEVDQ